MGLFVRNKPVENSQHALAILIDTVQIGTKSALEILRLHPFVDDGPGHVDILPKSVERVPAEEEAIEESRLALGGQRVEIVSWSHFTRRKDILAMVVPKDQVL